VLGQRQNVFLSIPQRRQVNGYDIQPVIKVFSKESFVHSLSQVYVRCGNDSDINLAWACLAERCKVTLLNHPEQLGLGLDRYIAYLVQKNRSAIGDLEIAFFCCKGAGEGPADMTEELRLEQFGRQIC